MKRRRNYSLWAGFLVVVFGLVSYIPIFALFPATRDFPWVNLLCFVGGGVLLGWGLKKAFRQPELYRGKISGSILSALSLVGIGLFCWGLFFEARRLPSAETAVRVGQKAPDFTLPNQNGKRLTLTDLLSTALEGATGAKASGAVLIFYRGHW